MISYLPYNVALSGRLVEALQQKEPIEWIKKLIDLSPNCIVPAFPKILKMNPQPSLEVIQLLVKKCPAALKQLDRADCYPLHYSCYYDLDLEIIQYLVNQFPAACLQCGNVVTTEQNKRLLPLEIVKWKNAEKKRIDFMTRETIDIACVFVESVFACKDASFTFFYNSQPYGFSEWKRDIGVDCLHLFGNEIVRADASLDRKLLLSKMDVDSIATMMRVSINTQLVQKPKFLELMEQIRQVNKAKHEFDKMMTVPFPDQPKTIMASN